ncbi:MAG: DUF2309 domain-containing protein [Planctomycetes bacterium]|nr:DUF2309 domain-containing protein [Planctomycetota bacterium]
MQLSPEERNRVRDEVAEACKPIAQSWPMKTFAYRNPLRGWESLPFDDAVRKAKNVLGGNGYIPNDEYRQVYRDGSISDDAVRQALQEVGPHATKQSVSIGNQQVEALHVQRLHLLFGLDSLASDLLDWTLSAGKATTRLRNDLPDDCQTDQDVDPSFIRELWDSSLAAVSKMDRSDEEADDPEIMLPIDRTISDWLGSLAAATIVDQINDQMIKWNAAFLDEGMSGWEMPDRKQGFYQIWRDLATRDWSGRLVGIKRIAKKIRELPDTPEDAIALGLDRLGIPAERRVEYLSRMLAQLPGWSGFIRWLGDNPSYPAQKQRRIDPVQYLAVCLFYEAELVEAFCRRRWGIEGTLSSLVNYWQNNSDEFRQLVNDSHSVDLETAAICKDGWRLFHLAQFLGLRPDDIKSLAASDIATLLGWLDDFPSDRHGLVWLHALETSYRERLLARLADHRGKIAEAQERPRAQFVLCIDARSESFRRHVEAQGPYETFGFAGFFGLPISFRAFDNDGQAALCPVIAAPGFEVHEEPRTGQDESLTTYGAASRFNRLGEHLFHDLKSNPVGSMMLIDALGLFYSARLIGKTFLSKPYESIKARSVEWFSRSVATRIPIDRDDDGEGDASEGLPHGFSVAEQATFVEKGLRAFGLTKNFGRFIVLCGHGSNADNNPYFAAYNCGACGGGHGDPNARVFAAMGNQPSVREAMKANGLDIPDDTWFLAGKHNTATDQVSFYDIEDVPESHAEDLRSVIEDLKEAGAKQALERCHRIPHAPTEISPQAAADHMVSRTVDWANVRPEWGLSSNAAFILGRRTLTKGLDLGGRAFLHSYDPDSDPEGTILEALMNAPLVVAQWISMEYYFSAVDPAVYGSGSKVTHNVVGGVGVMHGAHGDLQSGLPLQSVNDGRRHYHEPVRLLAILEAPTDRITNIIAKHTLLQHLFHNQWVNLVAVDPDTGEFHRYLPDATWQAESQI